MRADAFDFDLPEALIALRPARPRGSARLLEVRHGSLRHLSVGDLTGLLTPGDICVFNNTRVIPAQLSGRRLARPGGDAAIEPVVSITLHKRVGPAQWRAFAKPGRKLGPGDRLAFGEASAEIAAKDEGGEILLVFDREGAALDQLIARIGNVPLPPYITARRPVDPADSEDYQTVFASQEGSVAAPTAGLHFTADLLAALAEKGVKSAHVTLHVGAGTFLPVKSDDVRDHRMHGEIGHVSPAAAALINEARRAGGRIISIGTTALRLLESAATPAGEILPFSGETAIFITPGYRFRTADLLWTNFHLPRSTLFMLVCAFAGTHVMKEAYAEAIARGYRFYSYGDASLLYRATP